MATSSNQLPVPYSSSSPPSSWDVFLSFYGKDTRRNFTSHLYSALVHAGISTFMDDFELEKGEEISSGLLNAIRGSKIFVVVLSENYAYSRWCLDELVEILTCKRTGGCLVIPVFYYVDPSDPRYQKRSFGDALDHHKKHYSVDLIDKWRSALAEIAELSGYHLKTEANENESYTIQEIVENVTKLTSTKNLLLEKYLVGIDSSIEEIYQKLSMKSNDVRVIGICGMGGIGKSTTAKAFYNMYFNNFDVSCFVDDVKQHSQEGSYPLPLFQQLWVKLFERMDYKVNNVESGIRRLKQFLSTKKTLIVVDDLEQSSYSDFLVRLCNLLSAGSRIIFTTRDANLVDIYMMRELGQTDSLELFSYHAFRQPNPPESFKELAASFVTYAGGLPLALKVLGSSLLGRTHISFWKAKLAKVQKIAEKDIQKILQLSYDELDDETQKAIFLDIAFFFIGKDKNEVVHIFESCGFFPDVGIPVLVERCLLKVDENNMFQMHNLIQDMGKEAIREEFKHGNGKRLYLSRGARLALQNLEGVEKIEGLIIDRIKSPKRHFSAKILERMPNLRLLKIIGAYHVEGNLKNSFHELRCIDWSYCPWKRFPSSFHPEKLVSLDMPCSKIKSLWKGVMPSVNLKTINLNYSRNLKVMPDFSNFTSVDKLSLRGCNNLLKLHPSIGQLTNLSHLDIGECGHLKALPETIGQLTKLHDLDLGLCVNLKWLPETIKHLTNLGSLKLGGCSNLTRLPEQLGDIKCLKMLDASSTAIEQVPDSIGHLKDLVDLRLDKCKNLRKLPEQIGNMESLKFFDASSSAIEHLPDTFACLVNLVTLHLGSCENLTSLPNSLWKLKVLRTLYLSCSPKLEQLPEQLGKMQCLERLFATGTAIEELPDSIGLLSRLEWLDLRFCNNVRSLPRSIWNLTSLKNLWLHHQNMAKMIFPDTVKDMKLESLILSCNVWLQVSRSLSSKLCNLQYLTLHDCTSRECSFLGFPVNLTNLSIVKATGEMLPELSSLKQLKHLCIEQGIGLQLIPPLPPHLETLELYQCTSLKDLPDLSSLQQMKSLYIQSGISLQSIPPLPPHLERLDLYECTSLKDLPDLSMLKELKRLSFSYCSNLKSISLKQSFLQVCRC
ncbi:hypothetical protein DCAR_0309868 [Daucus carota subsp. sativus]|uniref:TIR domain-containing protein n=1 Tax=Daucus carota subsp. sativus TaxID=79200 RepID=A0AAF0WK67_DAUCS|nr:hypothetical protein DCAR_0309868 [Daucus carota subsp. sativus]